MIYSTLLNFVLRGLDQSHVAPDWVTYVALIVAVAILWSISRTAHQKSKLVCATQKYEKDPGAYQ